MTPPLVESQAELADLVSRLADEQLYAIDTEFHRERTYHPRVALVQVAWSGGIALVDPLAVDLEPFAEILEGPGTAVIHACDQDLEVLDQACGAVPSRLFDTQIAAGFVGMSSPSLAQLCDKVLGAQVPKGDRLTDWLARPLEANQLEYAACDVVHLIDLHDRLSDDLVSRGRLQWALDECERARARGRRGRDPKEAWRKIRDVRQLKGQALAVAQAVAEWREVRAEALDIPSRFVLPDLAVLGIAQRAPKDEAALKAIRGLDARQIDDRSRSEIIEAVVGAGGAPAGSVPQPPRQIERSLRPAVALVAAWVSQLARDLDLDPSLLATRADIEALLRGDEGARLLVGWRAELVGEPVRQLVSGEASVAFDRTHGLRLEKRSRAPLG